MLKFLSGFIAVAALFAVSFLIALLITVTKKRFAEKIPQSAEDDKPKIYYVKNVVKEKKRKKASKKTNVALKGLIVNPENLEKIKKEI